jgi:hypothetical protein
MIRLQEMKREDRFVLSVLALMVVCATVYHSVEAANGIAAENWRGVTPFIVAAHTYSFTAAVSFFVLYTSRHNRVEKVEVEKVREKENRTTLSFCLSILF